MTSNGLTCTFHSGGTTVSSYCEEGCCTDACCGESEISPTKIAIIVCSTVGGLLLLLLFALILFCIIRKRGWCQDRADAERAKPKPKPEPKVQPTKDWKKTAEKVKKVQGDDKEKLNWVINGKWDWHGWKKQRYGEDSKFTQTDNHKLQPGDYIMWSKSRWFPVKRDKNAIKDPRTNIKEVGVGTEKLDHLTGTKKDKKRTTTIITTAVGAGTDPYYVKPAAPVDTRVASPSQVKPYYSTSKQSGKTSDDGYQSKGKSTETPLSTPDRQDTMDSLRDFNTDVLTEAERAKGEEDFTVISDPNREERDRLEKLKVSGYVSTWQFPEVKRWNPHTKGVDPKNSKWAKAHNYAKNLNANK